MEYVRTIMEDNGREFKVPDLTSLMKSYHSVGDEVVLPINIHDGKPAFWEMGGRNPEYSKSIGTVISGPRYGMPDIILVNKRKRKANGRHALVTLKPNSSFLFVGKVFFKPKSLFLKVFELRFIKPIEEYQEENCVVDGLFEVTGVYTDYGSLPVPAEFLIKKLFTKNNFQPFYSNGWSTSNVSSVDKELFRIIVDNSELEKEEYQSGVDYVLAVEKYITELQNSNLSAALQVFDFDKGILRTIPLEGFKMKTMDASETQINREFVISLDDLFSCRNKVFLLKADCPDMLRLALESDEGTYNFKHGNSFIVLRGWKG